MKFKSNMYNVCYNRSISVGIPKGVDFKVVLAVHVKRKDGPIYQLTADGYGSESDYGVGPILVFGVRKDKRARFDKACNNED